MWDSGTHTSTKNERKRTLRKASIIVRISTFFSHDDFCERSEVEDDLIYFNGSKAILFAQGSAWFWFSRSVQRIFTLALLLTFLWPLNSMAFN